MSLLSAPPRQRVAIGVVLDGTRLRAATIDADRQVLHRTAEHVRDISRQDLLWRLINSIHCLLELQPDAEAVGIGVPCGVDPDGRITSAVNVQLAGTPLREILAEHITRPIVIDNDANVAALAEHRFGAARGVRDAVVLTIGMGVGGGVILDGRLLHTGRGSGPELGHVVIDLDGPQCPGGCPNRGCVEALASGRALERDAQEAARANPDSALGRMLARGRGPNVRELVTAARVGDGIAEQIVQRAGARLGVALASYANTFGPQRFVIGGGVAAAADEMLLEPARGELRARALAPLQPTSVHAAALGSDAGVIGAGVLALEATTD